MIFFDAHLDLAYLAVNGRDMLAPLDASAGPHAPGAVTLQSLAEGRVAMALATIFTEPDGTGPEGYAAGDADAAFAVGRAQLEVYATWRERGRVALDIPGALWIDRGVGRVRGGMGVSQVVPESSAERVARLEKDGRLHAGILIENADPIRSPDDLGWWKERGVCAVGMAWAKSSRYAGGNTTHEGITPLGRELVRGMDALGIVHDASHLSDRSFGELCGLTDRPIIASHSNCRAILGEPTAQRHLTDEQIREIAGRGGVIGLNLYAKFIDRRCGSSLLPPPLPTGAPSAAAGPGELPRPSVKEAIRHVEHICELTGSREHVGLGSDMDGGFGADRLPVEIDRPRDLVRLTEALGARGWSEREVEGFAFGNWARFWSGVALKFAG